MPDISQAATTHPGWSFNHLIVMASAINTICDSVFLVPYLRPSSPPCAYRSIHHKTTTNHEELPSQHLNTEPPLHDQSITIAYGKPYNASQNAIKSYQKLLPEPPHTPTNHAHFTSHAYRSPTGCLCLWKWNTSERLRAVVATVNHESQYTLTVSTSYV